MKYKLLTLVVIVCTFSLDTLAQRDDDKLPQADPNFKKYMDDGLLHNADATVQLAVTSLLPGFVDLSYEHKFNRAFSMEAGGGLKIFNGIDIINSMNDVWIEPSNFGYTYFGSIRYYPFKGGITQFGYMGVEYRKRTHTYDDGPITVDDYMLCTGQKKIYQGNFSFGLSQSFGARIYKKNYKNESIDDELYGGFIYTIQVKLGYFLKY